MSLLPASHSAPALPRLELCAPPPRRMHAAARALHQRQTPVGPGCQGKPPTPWSICLVQAGFRKKPTLSPYMTWPPCNLCPRPPLPGRVPKASALRSRGPFYQFWLHRRPQNSADHASGTSPWALLGGASESPRIEDQQRPRNNSRSLFANSAWRMRARSSVMKHLRCMWSSSTSRSPMLILRPC